MGKFILEVNVDEAIVIENAKLIDQSISDVEAAIKTESSWLLQSGISLLSIKPHKTNNDVFTDNMVAYIYEQLEDVTTDNDGNILSNFYIFSANTDREDIWKWIDTHYSLGVGYLQDEFNSSLYTIEFRRFLDSFDNDFEVLFTGLHQLTNDFETTVNSLRSEKWYNYYTEVGNYSELVGYLLGEDVLWEDIENLEEDELYKALTTMYEEDTVYGFEEFFNSKGWFVLNNGLAICIDKELLLGGNK